MTQEQVYRHILESNPLTDEQRCLLDLDLLKSSSIGIYPEDIYSFDKIKGTYEHKFNDYSSSNGRYLFGFINQKIDDNNYYRLGYYIDCTC